MKKTAILFMSLLTVLMISCSKANRLEKEAQEVMNATFHELAKDPESVKLTNIRTVYGDDSLCIFHFNFKAKNGLGIETNDKMEYVYLVAGETKYEAYQGLDGDSIFQSIETFEKTKKGRIYENLPYESAMYYRSAILINSTGREVGDQAREKDVKIALPTGTGMWEVQAYKDEFGEEGSKKYLRIFGKGYFSNSATTGSRMTAILFVHKTGFSFRFIEYDSHVVKDDGICRMRIKDSEDIVHDSWSLYNSKSGEMTAYFDQAIFNELQEILRKGGEIAVSAEMGSYSKSQYRFRMDVTGYEEALKFL